LDRPRNGDSKNPNKRKNNQIFIIAKDCLPKFAHQFDGVKTLSEHKGKDFIGQSAITPIIGREVLIAAASFLDSLHGTGIVYSSPAGAPHDFMALEEAKKEGRLPKEVEVINTVDTIDKKTKNQSSIKEVVLQKTKLKIQK